MNIINKLLSILFVVSLCCSSCSTLNLSKAQRYNFSEMLGEKEVVVVVEIKNNVNSICQDCIFWGGQPQNLIQNFSVRVNGKESFIRYSSFSDLSNIKDVQFLILEKGFLVEIDGGNSSSHYLANLFFDKEGYLVSRKVYNPAFFDEVWEQTEYSFIRRSKM